MLPCFRIIYQLKGVWFEGKYCRMETAEFSIKKVPTSKVSEFSIIFDSRTGYKTYNIVQKPSRRLNSKLIFSQRRRSV